MYRFLSFALVSILVLTSCSSKHKLDQDTFYIFKNNQLEIVTKSGSYKVFAVDEQIVSISYSDSLMPGNRVYGPILTQPIDASLKRADSLLVFATQKVKVEISFSPVHFRFYDLETGIKLEEEKGFHYRDNLTAFSFKLSEGEAIYGTGSRAIPQNRRGYKFQCFNQANYGYGVGADYLNYSVPSVLSSENYMVLIDNPARAWFDVGKEKSDVLDFASTGGNQTYYFINGKDKEEVLVNYFKLTGTQPMPPIWALGNLQSRFGYRSQLETETIVRRMLEAGYPLDAIIIDIYWFGQELQNGYMGNLSWDTAYWPDPDNMIRNFAEQGVKTVTVSEPFFTRKSKHFNYLSENKFLGLDSSGQTMTMPYFYFGDAGLIDIFKPEARQWFWQQYKQEKERGIAGWWGDLGEPEVHPDDMVHVNGLGRELHGVYGHEWVAMLFENYAKDYPDERLFKLGRAGYAGSQRYGLMPWSGDVARDWSGFRAQNNVMLGMSLSGLPYMHSDAGGFAMHPRDSILYMRWLQYAVFTPIFRPHGDPGAPPEPIFYHQKVQEIVKKAIQLRYAMLPYNYTLAWKTEQTGALMTTPMFLAFEEQQVSDTLSSQHMWGENLLVAPIWYKDAKERQVFLPKGDWYNFYTQEWQQGGQFITVKTEAESIPVFARGGSFITLSAAMQNTDQYKGDKLTVYCYLNADVNNFKGEVYFDNGYLKDAYKKGQYQLLQLECKNQEKKIVVSYKLEGNYSGAPQTRSIVLKLVGLSEAPREVLVNGQAASFYWQNNLLEISGLNTNEAVEISIL